MKISAPPYDKKNSDKFLKSEMYEPLYFLLLQFRTLDNLQQEKQENAFKSVMDKTGVPFGKIAQAVRVALTGTSVSPGIFEIILVLGKDVVIKRLEMAVNFISSKKT